jgi:hypothetical protein
MEIKLLSDNCPSEFDEVYRSLKSFRMFQRISAHRLILGLSFLSGPRQVKASSRILSNATMVASFLERTGSSTSIDSPFVNFFIACSRCMFIFVFLLICFLIQYDRNTCLINYSLFRSLVIR